MLPPKSPKTTVTKISSSISDTKTPVSISVATTPSSIPKNEIPITSEVIPAKNNVSRQRSSNSSIKKQSKSEISSIVTVEKTPHKMTVHRTGSSNSNQAASYDRTEHRAYTAYAQNFSDKGINDMDRKHLSQSKSKSVDEYDANEKQTLSLDRKKNMRPSNIICEVISTPKQTRQPSGNSQTSDSKTPITNVIKLTNVPVTHNKPSNVEKSQQNPKPTNMKDNEDLSASWPSNQIKKVLFCS